MFETERDKLRAALSRTNDPIPTAEVAEVIDATELKAESVVNRYAEVTDVDGVPHVVAVEGSDEDDDVEADTDSQAAEAAAEEEEAEPAEDPDPEPSTVEADSEPAKNGSEGATGIAPDVYEVNGLRVTVDPDEHLVGEPTGEVWYGLPVLEDGRDDIPTETTPYFPVQIGERDSEQAMGKVLGDMNRPLLFEGEAGTGKNSAIARAFSQTNRPDQRINFGADVSVFDLVGEKDFVEGVGSVYILGKLAKAAMFGHGVILDEVNMVTGDVSSFIHAVTEEVGDRQLELRGTDVTLRDIPVSSDEIEAAGSWYEAAREKWTRDEHLGEYIHPEFRVTATCNPLDYADTKSMNDAFRDRFVVLPHGYLPQDREAQLLAEETGVDADDVFPLVRLANVLRTARDEANALSTPITHRSLLKTIEFAGADESFMSFEQAARQVMVEHASTKTDKQYIRDAIGDEL